MNVGCKITIIFLLHVVCGMYEMAAAAAAVSLCEI
jgi:hypothetical protein